MAGHLLRDGLKDMKITGGGLDTYVETRWCSIYNTTNSIVRSQPVFDKVKLILNKLF
jgi:hypothetical protein